MFPMTITAPATPFLGRVSCGVIVALTKPRIIELLLVTTIPPWSWRRTGIPKLWLMVATLAGGTLAAGGANTFNMVIDRDIDAIMERTKRRPLVTGVMSPRDATLFATASRSWPSWSWRCG
jgi:protoheme IX farnesyltransferase